MKYVTLSDLASDIKKNLWKIPRDIDFIIGVPRSGTICASIISSYLNVPLIDINPFLAGLQPSGGLRLQAFLDNHVRTNRVLVVDDTVSSGRQMNVIKNSLKGCSDLEFIYMCVYLEGWADNVVDLYLEDIRKYTNNFTELVYYEWNIFQHNPIVMGNSLYDIDGVLCIDPPDERDEEKYLAYIKNATPFLIPRTKIGGIITYRLLKNKEITEKWLYDNGIKYNELIMFDANSWDERNKSGISPELYKGIFYKNSDKYKLFVESNDYQASKIFEIAKKPVLCVESNKLYQ